MKKLFSVMLSVVMAVSVMVPFTALAATTYDNDADHIAYNSAVDASSYNVSLHNGEDFANFEFTGFDKETKTLTVEAGETISFDISDGGAGYLGSYDSDMGDGTKAGQHLGWHYGANNSTTNRCISTDIAASITSGDYNFAVSGFFNAEITNTVTPKDGRSITSTCTLENGLPEGTYTFDVSYKIQFKNKDWKGSWSSNYDFLYTDTLTIVAVAPKTEGMGGSIRVGDAAGLRFGFKTDVAAEDIEEYGFLYTYAAVDELTPETEKVKTLVAKNYIAHDDGTTTFNLVFTNVPASAYDMDITACSYVVIDGTTYYSKPVTRNFRSVANAVLADETVDEAVKNAVQDLLNA